ncbi:Gtr1/RagA G protein conserved region-domain-containing protein [Dipodascopsis tothii]|uniref:Gtr1/RagA G protein conserved region-domain-containing protein n=1 Tax=Dipodascopsis tothii TaxID=44089 RepID=UPI0034CFCC42
MDEPADMAGGALFQSASPRIVMMGLRRGGKSSICQVMFHNMQPLDTLYIESTTKPTTSFFRSFIDFAVVELPGQIDFTEGIIDAERIFANVGALIYVIDSQDEYLNALANLHSIIVHVLQINPTINIEIFIHKVDGLSEDYRLDTQRDITQRVTDELLDVGIVDVSLSFHLTSIFDHSVYEAFSRVVQKLIPQLATLENLLNVLCQHSGIEKAFLFDMGSKIFVTMDSSPMDMPIYEVCSEFIDITVDLNHLYIFDDADADARGPYAGRPLGSTSRLSNGIVLYLQQMVKGLALVCLMRKESMPKIALVEYNIEIFRDALDKLWQV